MVTCAGVFITFMREAIEEDECMFLLGILTHIGNTASVAATTLPQPFTDLSGPYMVCLPCT